MLSSSLLLLLLLQGDYDGTFHAVDGVQRIVCCIQMMKLVILD